MGDGKWSGGAANRSWGRQRTYSAPDPERDAALWEDMAGMRFWCETCGGTHPLAEHKACREGRR